jgi:hypothetical protein
MIHPYARASYAAALAGADGGRLLAVPEWTGHAILRPVPGADAVDAAGPYPRTPFGPRFDLRAGLDRLRAAGAVSAVIVPDPLSAPPQSTLTAAFEHCRPFKTHFIVDRAAGGEWPSKHHRQTIRKARAAVQVSAVSLGRTARDWSRLHAGLPERHAVGGAADFIPSSVAALADDPSFEAFAARIDGRIVAMAIWFAHDGVATYHLGASDEAGYAVGAGYALFDAAFEHFDFADRFDLGGAAGVQLRADDGLARFKQGFANATATAYVCGSVLDAAACGQLSKGRASAGFFPAYRAPATLETAAA